MINLVLKAGEAMMSLTKDGQNIAKRLNTEAGFLRTNVSKSIFQEELVNQKHVNMASSQEISSI